MGRSTSIPLIVHFPESEEGKEELARSVSEIHADFVISTISKLDCPLPQKLELLQAVMDTVKGIYRAPDPPGPAREAGHSKSRFLIGL